ncbi:MAG: hypothetical protein RLZ12_223, partial [Bacillota bacterium]
MIKDYGGAAVLPYTYGGDGKRKFMLSRSAWGRSKGEWDDWGGMVDLEDQCEPKRTAVREFTEESIGLLGFYSTLEYLQSTEAACEVLEDKERLFVTFIIWVPEQALQLPDFYRARASLINGVQPKNEQEEKKYKSMLEKDKIA